MKILLSNDDGADAEGIWAMAHALKKDFDVAIAAPMKQQSGMSHALTLGRKLEFKRIENSDFEVWTIDGTPTDCVKFYLEDVDAIDKKICAVISGINHGSNLATDVLYSGTVGAALEGALHDIPALAVSVDVQSEISFESVAEETAKYFKVRMSRNEMFFNNINFPKKYRAGYAEFRLSRLGKRDYINPFARLTDEEGKFYFEIRGEIYDSDVAEDTDIYAVNHGYVSVTPLNFNVG